ncbi:sugar transferase [Paraferrimonas haliotis]|uniref:sugar transferase n=1 Tax=Paraferrimonas haliotis TaxID=2013866 RepID=UPI000BA99C1B|nr:sugar transferase [Paraferrimonas haliotis]
MKRVFDVTVSLVLIIACIPVFFILSIIVKAKMGVPVIFRQNRPGKNEVMFSLYKYRTMTDEVDAKGLLLPDNRRLTSFGKFIRSTSLDELPSLFNVLKGDMSLVGPRPLLEKYLPLYNEKQAKRHNVRPGITGWAQINGRNGISWEEKFELDVWYVENRTFWLDIKILFLTVKKVFCREGISAVGHVTSKEFTGSKKESAKR